MLTMKKKIVALCIFLALLTAGVSRYAWYTFTDFTDSGVDKLDNKDPVGALIDFNRAIKKNNKDPAPFLFSAITYMRGGRGFRVGQSRHGARRTGW